MPIEDRSVLSPEEKQRRLQELLLELAQKSEALPPGGPQEMIAQRTAQINAMAANGNTVAALRAAETLVRATAQAAYLPPLTQSTQQVAPVPEAARTAVRVLELRVKQAKATGDAEEIRKSETELKQALDMADRVRTDALTQQDAANKINRLALERSAFGFDHLMISTEARVRPPTTA